MPGPLKIQRTALLHLMTRMYKALNKQQQASNTGSLGDETDDLLLQVEKILKHEGFL